MSKNLSSNRKAGRAILRQEWLKSKPLGGSAQGSFDEYHETEPELRGRPRGKPALPRQSPSKEALRIGPAGLLLSLIVVSKALFSAKPRPTLRLSGEFVSQFRNPAELVSSEIRFESARRYDLLQATSDN